jgi:phenylacetate-CoA ligase
MLGRIVGRVASAFVRPDGGTVLPDFWIRLFAIEFNTGKVYKYQCVQEEPDRIVVKLVLVPGREAPGDRMRSAVTRRIRDVMGAPVRVDFEVVDDIPPTESGKHLYSVSKVRSASASA